MSIPIRWGDMDAMNHVNNTTYFRYLETCAHRLDPLHRLRRWTRKARAS